MAGGPARKLTLEFQSQPEGGCTVTCPVLPGPITEGDTIVEELGNVGDALIAIVETYEDLGCALSPLQHGLAAELHIASRL